MRIDDYLDHLQQIMTHCPVVSTKTVTLDARTDSRGIIKGTLCFINGTVLHYTEVVDVKTVVEKIKYRYQYQWMDSNERIFRYDNAKHYSKLATFPHHKHVGPETVADTVIQALEVSLEDVLREIEQHIMTQM